MSISIDQESFDKKNDIVYRNIMKNYNIDYESAKEVFKTLVKANSKGVKINSVSMIDMNLVDFDTTLREINELEKDLQGIYIDGMF